MPGVDDVAGGKQSNRHDPQSGAAAAKPIADVRDPETGRDSNSIKGGTAADGIGYELASAGPALRDKFRVRYRRAEQESVCHEERSADRLVGCGRRRRGLKCLGRLG